MLTRLTVVVVALATVGGFTEAFGQPAAAPASDNAKDRVSSERSATNALETLLEIQGRGGSVLVDQSDLDPLIRKGGGGACPSAAAVVAYQAMRVLAGLEPDQHPHKVAVAAFASDPTLLQGRLTNTQFINLLRHYGGMLEGATIDVEAISAPNSPHAIDGKTWGMGASPNGT